MKDTKLAVLLLSDVYESLQIEVVAKVLANKFDNFFVLYKGSKDAPIYHSLVSSGISRIRVINLDSISKIKLMRLAKNFFLAQNHSEIYCFASGSHLTIPFELLSRLRGAKEVVLYRHYANLHELLGSKKGAIKDFLEEKFATRILCASNTSKEALIQRGVNSSKITVIRYCVDLQPYTKVWNLNTHNKRSYDSTFKIGVVSRISKTKGISLLLNAVQIVRQAIDFEVQVEIVGQPSDDTQLAKDLKNGLWPFVKWIGFHKNPASLYQDWDLLAHLPVSKYAEGFGIVYVEALASGIPCLFSRSGIINDLDFVAEGVTIIDNLDVEYVAEQILENIRNREVYKAREFNADKFTSDRMFQEFESMIETLLDSDRN